MDRFCIHDGFVYFPKLSQPKRWLYYIFESQVVFGGLGKLGTQLNLNTETVKNISIPFPSQKERTDIIAFLDTETSKIDTLIDKAKQSISLLKERRSSLISAAVTGKIDVREAS
jgi:type I restriction enzyme S subunit